MIPSTSRPASSAKADPSESTPNKVGSSESCSSDPEEVESDGSESSHMQIPLKKRHQTVSATPQFASTSSAKAGKPKKQAAPVPPTAFYNDVLNRQDVQRIIVEHVNKNKASALSVGSKRLRSFSGRVPKPPGEVDFETWCQFVELMFQDGLPTIMQRRMLLESLLCFRHCKTTSVQLIRTRLCKTTSVSIWKSLPSFSVLIRMQVKKPLNIFKDY